VPRPEFREHLAAALGALARDVPLAHAELTRALDGMSIRIEVNGRACGVRCSGGAHAFDANPASCDAEVTTDAATILDLADARVSLVEAIRSDRLRVQGPAAAVARFDRGLGAFLAGAVRSPAFPALLDDLRSRGVASTEDS